MKLDFTEANPHFGPADKAKPIANKTTQPTEYTPPLSFAEKRRLIEGRELEILSLLGIQPPKRDRHMRCPYPDHEDRNPSWRWDDGARRWFCTCGDGDIIDAIERMNYAASSMEALEWAIEQISPHASLSPPPAEPAPAISNSKTLALAQNVWRESEPIGGTLAERYLRAGRGLDSVTLGDDLKFNRNLWCQEAGAFLPALVALVRDSAFSEMGIQRIWLDPNNASRANVKKKSAGTIKGGAFYNCQPTNGHLGLAEGPETALSVQQIFGLPCAATLSAQNLKNFNPPDGVTKITIFADSDEPGRKGASQAAKVLRERGLDVEIQRPLAPGGDFADDVKNGATADAYPDPEKAPETPPESAVIIGAADVFELLQNPAPPREWLCEGLIPANDVSLLAGDGGTGKTLVALQLAYASAYGWKWLEREVTDGPVIYFGAEDPMSELHYRLEKISNRLVSARPSPNRFKVVSASHTDAELVTFDEDCKLTKSLGFMGLERDIAGMGAKLLVLDAQADVFGGDEINRRQVRAFVRELRGLALRNQCTVLLLAHPSKEGMKTGIGYSGSTHWNNAVRSRLYFTTPTHDGGAEIDPDLRELKVMKSNRARKGEIIRLRFKDDFFCVETPIAEGDQLSRAHARTVFIDLLRELTRQGRKVGPNVGPSYAPAVFEREPDGENIQRKAFAYAMAELFKNDKIETFQEGPPSRSSTYIRLKDCDAETSN